MKRFLGAAAAAITLAIGTPPSAHAFWLGFSAMGGIGAGYYAMGDLNGHLNTVRQGEHIKLDQLASGINFKADGRLWFYDRVAVSGGYEHLWGESVSEGSSTTQEYKAPADVYTIGLAGTVFDLPNIADFCIGVNRLSAKAVFGTTEGAQGRRLAEFTGRNVGFEVYGEIHSNFINPVQVGLQAGYRNLKFPTLYLRNEVGFFNSGDQMALDYSGFFFYLVSSIHI